jgi:ribonuclease HI
MSNQDTFSTDDVLPRLPKSGHLFCDGGVVSHNPSELGGTWACTLVWNGHRIVEMAGAITPVDAQMPAITNNLTEMLALVRGLLILPEEWSGTICSDSQITLGRAFMGWKWKNIPAWLHHDYQRARARLKNWDKIEFQLLQGHPTKAELTAGVGSRGYPVSEHNVWCDKACGEIAASMETFPQDVFPGLPPKYKRIQRRMGYDWCGKDDLSWDAFDCDMCLDDREQGFDSAFDCPDCHGAGEVEDVCCDFHAYCLYGPEFCGCEPVCPLDHDKLANIGEDVCPECHEVTTAR